MFCPNEIKTQRQQRERERRRNTNNSIESKGSLRFACIQRTTHDRWKGMWETGVLSSSCAFDKRNSILSVFLSRDVIYQINSFLNHSMTCSWMWMLIIIGFDQRINLILMKNPLINHLISIDQEEKNFENWFCILILFEHKPITLIRFSSIGRILFEIGSDDKYNLTDLRSSSIKRKKRSDLFFSFSHHYLLSITRKCLHRI